MKVGDGDEGTGDDGDTEGGPKISLPSLGVGEGGVIGLPALLLGVTVELFPGGRLVEGLLGMGVERDPETDDLRGEEQVVRAAAADDPGGAIPEGRMGGG